jgi:hypothetical protein
MSSDYSSTVVVSDAKSVERLPTTVTKPSLTTDVSSSPSTLVS